MKNRRKYLLISPKYQFKTVLFMNIIAFIFFVVSCLVIANISRSFFVQSGYSDDALNSFFRELFPYIIILNIAFQLFSSVLLLFHTHKSAGPIFKTKKVIDGLLEGKKEERVEFRKDDFFQDLSESLVNLNNHFEERGKIITRVEQSLNEVSQEKGNQELSKKLLLIKNDISQLRS